MVCDDKLVNVWINDFKIPILAKRYGFQRMSKIINSFVLQGLGLLLPMLFMPLIYKWYGPNMFGVYALSITLATFLSFGFTLKLESAFAFEEGNDEQIKLVLSAVNILMLWVLVAVLVLTPFVYHYAQPDLFLHFICVVIISFVLSIFNIINGLLVIKSDYQYYYLQIFKAAIFACSAYLFSSIDNGLLISIFVSYFTSVMVGCFINRHAITFDLASYSDLFKMLKATRGFFIANVLNSGRELVVITFIGFNFGVTYVAWYYFLVMYMLKPALAYTTVVNNYLRRRLKNEICTNELILKMVGVGAVVFCILFAFLLVVDHYKLYFNYIDFKFFYFYLFAPFSFSYLCLGVFSVLLNHKRKGDLEGFIFFTHAIFLLSVLFIVSFFELNFPTFILLISILFLFMFLSRMIGFYFVNKKTEYLHEI